MNGHRPLPPAASHQNTDPAGDRQIPNDAFQRLPQRFFAAVEPGVEELALAELRRFGVVGTQVYGGLEFEAKSVDIPLLLRLLRLPGRLWWSGPQLPVRSVQALAGLLGQVPVGCQLGRIDVVGEGVDSRRLAWLQHSAKAWLGQHAQELGEAGFGPPDRALLRATPTGVQLRVDAAGGPLYQRGWRTEQGEAPLRETAAARLLAQAGWPGWQPGGPQLWDPMCGSGTLVIEAATWGRPLPAGLRSFAIERWLQPSLSPAQRPSWPAGLPTLLASDRDPEAVARTEANLHRAGIERGVETLCADMAAVRPTLGPDGWVVCNPPWGQRLLGRNEARRLVERLAAVIRRNAPGWQAALLVPEQGLANGLGLRDLRTAAWSVGGQRVWLVTGRLPK